MDFSYIDKNIETIRNNIRRAAASCGRDESEITLLAATKYADAQMIDHIHKHLGVTCIGENRVGHLKEHIGSIDRDGLDIHFIGSLQTNKVKYIIDKVSLIHSVDSLRLAQEIDRCAAKHGIVSNVLIEVNSGMEESKGGAMPCDVKELYTQVSALKNIRVCGFMTMAPKGCTQDEYRRYFGDTKRLCDSIWYADALNTEKPRYSMGMSDSYEVAIECGADIVRLGGAIFAAPNT